MEQGMEEFKKQNVRTTQNDLGGQELPYEKFRRFGPENLTEAELLAIILRTGTANKPALALAKEILKIAKFPRNGLLGLYDLSLEELMEIKGIGEVKAVKLKCLTELSMRLSRANASRELTMNQPETVAEYYMEKLRHLQTECVYLACFDAKSQLISEKKLSDGSVNRSLISPREIFIEALSAKAVHIILIHNHPSGDPTPSGSDIELTRSVYHMGEELSIPLSDHIVIGDNLFFSFRQNGLLPFLT